MTVHKSYEEVLKNHSAIKNPLFDYLKDSARDGFTPLQYRLYRDNYIYRTCQTVISVAHTTIAAAKNKDMETLATAGKNLYEESGMGVFLNSHLQLLSTSHNLHGDYIFGLAPIDLKDVFLSPYILPETKNFIAVAERLYTHENYPTVLGASYAQESAAVHMINDFYQSLFLPYKGHYNKFDFQRVDQYFADHLNGMEENHAHNASVAIEQNSQTSKELAQALEGVIGFLDAQSQLWTALHKAMQKAEIKGNKVPNKIRELPNAAIISERIFA